MTRKQYNKKMRQLQRNLFLFGKANGMGPYKSADRVAPPHWGTIIPTGKHAGERLTSYAQAWDMVSDCLKGSDLLQGIE